MIRSRLLLAATSFAFLSFRDADQGGGSGGSDGKSAATPPAEDAAPKIEGVTHEEKLQSAESLIGSLHGSVKKLTADLATATSDREKLQSQFDELTTTANDLKADKTRLEGEVTSLTQDRDAQRGRADKAEGHVGNLEKLCGVKGIDPAEALKQLGNDGNGGGAGAQSKAEEYKTLLSKESKGEVPRGTAHKFYRANKKDIEATA